MKYFAYGSNLNKDDLINWCKEKGQPIPNLSNPKALRLENYRLGFTRYSESRGGGVADIISSLGDFCWGVVFDVTESDLKILDIKEGANPEGKKLGTYRRLTLPNMITYEVVEKKDFVQPHSDYLDVIIRGATEHGLSSSWVSFLKSFKKPQ